MSEHSTSGGEAVSKDPTERQEIRFRRRGPLAEIILTREKALNALSLDMIQQMDSYLAAWNDNPGVRAVAIYGSGEKAFCAGGDVRAVWQSAREGGDLPQRFFATEYTVNRRIRLFAKPFLALIDGATMGGGVGISVHGSHRVAGDRTQVAMPETGIGFFPDVGTTYVLSRLPGEIGTYMALTGARLGAADAVYTGLATHYVPSETLLTIPDSLVSLSNDTDMRAAVDRAIAERAQDPGPAPLAELRSRIDACFGHDRVEDILDALARDGSDWAQRTRASLDGLSPTSLKLTLAALRRAAGQDFDTCLKTEYRLSQGCMAGHDFHEGIRSVLVDKDKAPQWSPARLAEVEDATIARYFEPLGARELTFDAGDDAGEGTDGA